MAFEDSYPWIILLNNIITLISSLIAIILSTLLIILHHQSRHLVPYSPVMNLYLIGNVLTGIFTFIGIGYLLIFWRPVGAVYSAQMLFILGGISIQSLTYIPLIETFLCLDRCFVILFPVAYGTFYKYLIAFLTAFIYVFIAFGYNYFTNLLSSFPSATPTSCMVFLCQKDRNAQLITVLLKSSVAVINVAGTAVLGCLMKHRITAAKAVKRINQVVFHMLISTVVLVFIPNIAAFVAHLYYFKLADYVGPYGATLTAVNMAVCSIIYWKMFRKSISSPKVTIRNNTTSRTTMSQIRLQ